MPKAREHLPSPTFVHLSLTSSLDGKNFYVFANFSSINPEVSLCPNSLLQSMETGILILLGNAETQKKLEVHMV